VRGLGRGRKRTGGINLGDDEVFDERERFAFVLKDFDKALSKLVHVLAADDAAQRNEQPLIRVHKDP
jgi:hypothetical protein